MDRPTSINSFHATFIVAILAALPGSGSAVEAGVFTFKLRGRDTCNKRGFLAIKPCTVDNFANIVKEDKFTGRQQWWVTPAGGGGDILSAPVLLRSGGRTGCGQYATVATTCDGPVALRVQTADNAQRQRWLLQPQPDGSYTMRPESCPGKLLSFNQNCLNYRARIYDEAFDKALNKFDMARLASFSAEGPGVAVTTRKVSDWGTGYEAAIYITNGNVYKISNWKLQFSFSDSFTWGPDGVTATRAGSLVTLEPVDWARTLLPGAILTLSFGGTKLLPEAFTFTQILPPLNPGSDPSLATRGSFGAKVFSPYLDILQYPTPVMADIIGATGQKFYTLAFIVAKGSKPSWGGVIDLDDWFFWDQVREVRLQGGDVIVSFGGANGQELALAIPDAATLAAAYQSVIDMYQLRWVDFDIEGGAIADKASVDRRNAAIKILQSDPKNAGLAVSYTLPVLPSGLTAEGVALLASAKRLGVRVDVVSVMAMDYGDSAAPNPSQVGMGTYALQAVSSTHNQVLTVGFPAGAVPQMGLIPMIGVNDVSTEVFNVTEGGCKVVHFAATTSWMRLSSFWSVNRDNYDGTNGTSPTSSGIPQQPYAFTKLFAKMDCVGFRGLGAGAAALPPQGPLPRRLSGVPKLNYLHNWQLWTDKYPGSD